MTSVTGTFWFLRRKVIAVVQAKVEESRDSTRKNVENCDVKLFIITATHFVLEHVAQRLMILSNIVTSLSSKGH
jgi:hypothetical protein